MRFVYAGLYDTVLLSSFNTLYPVMALSELTAYVFFFFYTICTIWHNASDFSILLFDYGRLVFGHLTPVCVGLAV